MNGKTIKNKWEVIKLYLAGKSVLDVGCCGQAGTLPRKRVVWLHEKIVGIASETVGIDIQKSDIDALKSQGFSDIIHGDVETVKLGKQFDAVFAGELIEHLSNPGMFLGNMYRHLKTDGHLIITTPNRFSALPIYEAVVYKYITIPGRKDYPGHVNSFDINTLTALASRHHFEIESWCYIRRPLTSLKLKVVLGLFLKFRPIFNANILAVFRKV